jgi:hypothetical protein
MDNRSELIQGSANANPALITTDQLELGSTGDPYGAGIWRIWVGEHVAQFQTYL